LRFRPLEGTNLWVRTDYPCPLEQEIQSYDTVRFRPRPPELDDAYEERQAASIVRRKLRLRGLLDKDDNPVKGVNFAKLVQEELRKRKQRGQDKDSQRDGDRPTKKAKSKNSNEATAEIVYESLKAPQESATDPTDNDDDNDECSASSSEQYDSASDDQGGSATRFKRGTSGMTFAPSISTARIIVTAPENPSDFQQVPLPLPTVEIYRGPPQTNPKRAGIGAWPEGWIQITKQRIRDGHKDSQWHSPGGKVFFNLAHVKGYLEVLKETDGDEDKAKGVFQAWKLAQRNQKSGENAAKGPSKSRASQSPARRKSSQHPTNPTTESTASQHASPAAKKPAESPTSSPNKLPTDKTKHVSTLSPKQSKSSRPKSSARSPGRANQEKLPDGWMKVKKKRQNGGEDTYWYTPGGKVLRSNPEVNRFLKALEVTGGDEGEAYLIFKTIELV
jgi:Methyl-CpG binding domain